MDLMGPYPLFSCTGWSSLPDDLENLNSTFVSLVVVVDPIADADLPTLRRAFPDRVIAMKQHFILELGARLSLPIHHRRQLRRAEQSVDIHVCPNPIDHLDEWVRLYAELSTRHRLTGIHAFSFTSFRQQLQVPGMFAVLARRGAETVSMALWLIDGDKGYYHLGASASAGYEVGASYAVFAAALDYLKSRGARVVDFGGAAADGRDGAGLIRFKQGWANAERPAYLCGRIFDRPTYSTLSRGRRAATDWFPAYRSPESHSGAPTGDTACGVG